MYMYIHIYVYIKVSSMGPNTCCNVDGRIREPISRGKPLYVYIRILHPYQIVCVCVYVTYIYIYVHSYTSKYRAWVKTRVEMSIVALGCLFVEVGHYIYVYTYMYTVYI